MSLYDCLTTLIPYPAFPLGPEQLFFILGKGLSFLRLLACNLMRTLRWGRPPSDVNGVQCPYSFDTEPLSFASGRAARIFEEAHRAHIGAQEGEFMTQSDNALWIMNLCQGYH